MAAMCAFGGQALVSRAARELQPNKNGKNRGQPNLVIARMVIWGSSQLPVGHKFTNGIVIYNFAETVFSSVTFEPVGQAR